MVATLSNFGHTGTRKLISRPVFLSAVQGWAESTSCTLAAKKNTSESSLERY
jgi:hypothetical protein